ncbi:MAG: ABC-F family ATP-binding cassette domain-containing protein [Caulobacteraceae bacterium]
MLRIHDLVFDAWGRRFFDHATVTLPVGSKVGLVGRNGAGKSTLFRLIQGQLSPSGGDIDYPKASRLGSVDQEHPATPIPLIDTVLAADVERASLTAELETAPPERLGDIYARLSDIDADRAPSRAAEILSGLGFSTADLTRPMAEFSGGWRMRVAMAAALFAEPDLLLLDEPTNYLDLEGALWLEARLRKYPRTALVISHDRELLDHSVDGILHLTEGRLDYYTGGFSDFERQRAEKNRLLASTREKIEAKKAHMQAFVDRFRATASKARQAQSRMKMIARLDVGAPAVEEHVAPFILPSPLKPLAPPLVRLEGASVGYGGPPVLRNLNLRLDLDDRIGLLGVNGSGKSTFARMIAGDLAIEHGHIHRDRRIKVGWFHQHQIEALDPDDTPLAIIRRIMPEASEAQRRSRLARFGMTVEKVETTVAGLSGGERARLLLNLVAMERPHLLILDEPTNHLDIDSRRALTEALNDYAGAVILITHDRSLMELVADRLWLVSDGSVKAFDGDMDDYAKFVLDRARGTAKGAAKPSAHLAPAAAKPAPAPLKRKLEAAEAKLARETRLVAELDGELADPAIWARDPSTLSDMQRRRARAADRLAAVEADWMRAGEVYEAAKIDA